MQERESPIQVRWTADARSPVPAALHHSTFVTAQIPQSGRGPLPDGSRRMWSPITSTLIMGRSDAVLVDPPMTTQQAAEVGDWVAASGRNLRQIYVTHGHGDHWFGAIPLLQRFPGVAVTATKGTTKLMAAQSQPDFRAEFWDRIFPGQIPAGDVEVSVVDESGFELEGSGFSRSKPGTPTPTPRRCCMYPKSGCWWPATSSTTEYTSTSPKPAASPASTPG